MANETKWTPGPARAAPNLYAALLEQAGHHDADGTPCFCGETDGGEDEHAAFCRSARAALSKAEGR